MVAAVQFRVQNNVERPCKVIATRVGAYYISGTVGIGDAEQLGRPSRDNMPGRLQVPCKKRRDDLHCHTGGVGTITPNGQPWYPPLPPATLRDRDVIGTIAPGANSFRGGDAWCAERCSLLDAHIEALRPGQAGFVGDCWGSPTYMRTYVSPVRLQYSARRDKTCRNDL
jgi:hypothetical protein